jgi:polysaccharide export outer membrane protein
MYILTKIKSFLLFVVVIFALTSCVTSRKVNYLQDGKHIAQYADSVEYVDYTVKAGDILYVYVNSLDKESQNLFNGGVSQNNSTYANNPLYSYNIYEDGTIDFPALGKIYVAEKSVREIKFLLQEKLKDFMTHFSVEVRLQNRTFSVIGETGTGRYSMPKEKINIFQALAMCGDLSNFSDRGKIQLIRQVGEETKVFEIDEKSHTIQCCITSPTMIYGNGTGGVYGGGGTTVSDVVNIPSGTQSADLFVKNGLASLRLELVRLY